MIFAPLWHINQNSFLFLFDKQPGSSQATTVIPLIPFICCTTAGCPIPVKIGNSFKHKTNFSALDNFLWREIEYNNHRCVNNFIDIFYNRLLNGVKLYFFNITSFLKYFTQIILSVIPKLKIVKIEHQGFLLFTTNIVSLSLYFLITELIS